MPPEEITVAGCLLKTIPVYATGKTDFGVNELTNHYNERYGFVKLGYQLYGGEQIIFTLTRVKEA